MMLEDDFSDNGSTLKLYSGQWTADMLSNKLPSKRNVSSLKLFYTLRHDKGNRDNYLVRIADAVKFAIKY
jgi:hypothetical protein